ncbi:S-adenosyl-L-methionine-dependent methyltransferase [Cantharellus anzutake]|uniref:S-adenosyl-L-methionine-dependent methyltransferase n=1 Tax=Cantharellus anzutake TaxID=1750568 RepID=UPI0019045D3C|nr:S-adenosyl-L-methionine-dependent methyltransferase [Cantharellus anzutake]KAF8339562.1 S-adenosyl-L-methionine-dependent methyltransferase [Cantharellus anzutake]
MASEIQPSRLGTKEHWEEVYTRELRNFEEFSDEGEVWFGRDSVEKIVDWCLANIPPSSLPYCLDIGTGNGSLLFALADAGYEPNRLQGIDYSPSSTSLARAIAFKRNPIQSIALETFNFLGENPWGPLKLYPERASNALREGGYFIITSCNFTQDELIAAFTHEGLRLAFHSRIKYPTFTFGGQTGSAISTVAFQKK